MENCFLCGREVHNSSALSYELRDLRLCTVCREELDRIRRIGEETPREERALALGKFEAYRQAHWTEIRDPRAKQYLDGIEARARQLAPSEEECRRILREKEEAGEQERELLTEEKLRKELKGENRAFLPLLVPVFVFCGITLIVSINLVLESGSVAPLIGLAFALLLGLFFISKTPLWKGKGSKQLQELNSGNYTLRVCSVLRKETHSDQDSESQHTYHYYYLILGRPEGGSEWRFSVTEGEQDRAAEGDRYYVLLVGETAHACYAVKDYILADELKTHVSGWL